MSPATTQSSRSRWNEAAFYADLEKTSGPDAVAAVRPLSAWSQQNFDWISWGNGKKYPSFLAGISWDKTRHATAFAVYPYGNIEITLEYLRGYPPFDDEARRRSLLREVNQIPGANLPENEFNRRPSFPVTVLGDSGNFALFTQIMERVARELCQAQGNSAGK